MKRGFFIGAQILSSLLLLSGCANFFNEKFAEMNEEYAKAVGTTPEHLYSSDKHNPPWEGYYIDESYWKNGTFDRSNCVSGEIWSFDVVAGETYSIFASGYIIEHKSDDVISRGSLGIKTEVHMGIGGGIFDDRPLIVHSENPEIRGNYFSEAEGNWVDVSGSIDLFEIPYIFTAAESSTIYLKVLSNVRSTRYDGDRQVANERETGTYKICVRHGRNGNDYVPLRFSGIPVAAWTENTLLFANTSTNRWHDYIENVDYDWVDSQTYSFEVEEGKRYIIFADGKPVAGRGGSGNYTASVLLSPYYGDYNSLMDGEYQYADNDSYHEGYPFVSPITGTIYIRVEPENNSAANLGTYRIAVTEADDTYNFLPLDLDSYVYHYQYRVKNPERLAVGNVIDVTEDFELVKYDGTIVSSNDIENWGWSSDTLKRWSSYLLCHSANEGESTTYLYATYEGEDYPCYFRVKPTNLRNPRLYISHFGDIYVGVGTNFYLYNNNTSVGADWYYADAENPDSAFTAASSYIEFNSPGSYYVFAVYNGQIVYEEVNVPY